MMVLDNSLLIVFRIYSDSESEKIVVVKAFNIGGKLNQTANGKKPIVKTDTIKLPTRVIELEFKEESD